MAKQDITEKILLVMMFKKDVNISKTKKILRDKKAERGGKTPQKEENQNEIQSWR